MKIHLLHNCSSHFFYDTRQFYSQISFHLKHFYCCTSATTLVIRPFFLVFRTDCCCCCRAAVSWQFAVEMQSCNEVVMQEKLLRKKDFTFRENLILEQLLSLLLRILVRILCSCNDASPIKIVGQWDWTAAAVGGSGTKREKMHTQREEFYERHKP